ncbi:MAG: hypothetical protein V3R94_07085 [Acidobacteriota bacterium]
MESAKAIDLALTPKSRLDVINVTERLTQQWGDLMGKYKKALYYSYHTTAGYFDRSFCARLNHDCDSLRAYVKSFQQLFPPDADYQHDQMEQRTELSEQQRVQEPRNADSHLTFMGSGLSNCATYSPRTPVYFVDLDGVYDQTIRERQTTVIGFNTETVAATATLTVPVSGHTVDSVNLKDSRLGLYDELQELLKRHEIVKGRIDLSLAPNERYAGLTVNEFETYLMQHDLIEVLRNPLRFMAEKGKHMLEDPKAIPSKARDYAKYDLVHLANEFLDALGLSESLVETVVNKFLAVPAERFLRMKRSVSLPISDHNQEGTGSILQGLYQSPILVQWKKSEAHTRRLNATIVRFE